MVPAGAGVPLEELVKPARDQVTPSASPAALKVTELLVPMAEVGGVTVRAMGLAVPETLMTWGELGALSVMVMVSERAPVSEGVKLTEMAQLAMEATEPVQEVLVVAKSLGLVPPTTTEVMLRAPVPELVTRIVVGVPMAP